MQKNQFIKAGVATLGTALALATAQVATAATARSAAVAGPKVSITIQGKSKTLLATETVQGRTGSIKRGGAPSGKCPADSAQGALNVATHGNWTGKWYSSYDEYFITGILGESETSKKYYWGLYVNGKLSSKGACEIKLKSSDKLLFKVTKG
jgi:hypothetical protein